MTEPKKSDRHINTEGGNYHEDNRPIIGNTGNVIENFAQNISIFFGCRERSPELQKHRHWLLKKIETEVNINFHRSLHLKMKLPINLYREAKPEEVKDSNNIVKMGDYPQMSLSPEARIIDVFDSEIVAGKLLILGKPGSGKTMTMLELAEKLIQRAKSDPEQPIPVLFNLSSWKDNKQPIKSWLIERLKRNYGVSRDVSKSWLENRELLPMLDGLDELESSRQELCVKEINQFLQDCHPHSLVACSRLEEYRLYRSRLQLNEAISLLPLTTVQIENYLRECDRSDLWRNIQSDASLLELLKTPWWLRMTVAAEILIWEWKQLQGNEERLNYLMDAYIDKMLGKDCQTRRWLIWLARQMEKQSQTEFLIEKMQPAWLRNTIKKLIYGLVYGIISGLIYGIILGLVTWSNYRVILALILGIILGLSWGIVMGIILGFVPHKISTADLLKFSWNRYFTNLKTMSVLGLILGIASALLWGIFVGEFAVFVGGIFSLIYVAILGIFSGLVDTEMKARIIPNQGVWNSLSNARYLLIITSPAIVASSIGSSMTDSGAIKAICCLLALIFPASAIAEFGSPCMKHFSLRLIFYLTGKIPWNYARFLDSAVECRILQRVGGGYRFIHKLLQEHFASMKQ